MKHNLLCGIAATALCLLADPAWAQDSTPKNSSDTENGNRIQEIIVTANRVESTAQKTPIALTVYTGADLIAKGVSNVQGLATIDPSVNVTMATGAAYVAMRGIASTDITEIGDPSVPISRDGFYTNRSYAIQASLYDVKRVEVLKGPQGTLNGRNSTGGLINIVTMRPEFSNGAYFAATVGNYGTLHGEGAVNLALSDKLAFRGSLMYDYHNGYRTITGLYNGQGERGDDSKIASGRIQLAWNPTEAFHVWLSYQRENVDGIGDVAMNSALGVRPDFGNAKTFSNLAPTSVDLRGDRVRWEVRYDKLPGNLRLIYAGGYDVIDWHHAFDLTGAAYPAVRNFLQHEHPKTWNHEVRISNDPASRFFFQGGYFHFLENNSVLSGVFNDQMQGVYAPGGPSANLGQAGVYGILFDYPSVVSKSDAVFGQVSLALTYQLKLSAGARYTWDHKTRIGSAALNFPALVFPEWGQVFPFTTAVTQSGGTMSNKKPTFHVGLDFNPSSTSLLYAKFDTGYKSGGFNSNGSAPSLPYEPETVSTYEVGSKNRFLNGKVELNIDAFYSRYKSYQAYQNSSVLQGNGVFNVGGAKIYGGELQLIALIGETSRIDFNGAYLHTRFDDNIFVADGAGTTHNIGGNRLPNAPSLSFTSGIEEKLQLASGSLTARLEGKYSSSFYYSVFNTNDTISHPYLVGNFSLTYTPVKGSWTVGAYARNFTDKVVLSNASENFAAGKNTYQFQPPRTFGVTGSVKF